MADGFCNHREFRGKYIYTKRDIFSCEEHKHQADYSDYKAKSKIKGQIKNNLAPLTAKPKYSKGDNPRYRFKKKTTKGKKSPIKTVDGWNREHYYKITRFGIKEIKL